MEKNNFSNTLKKYQEWLWPTIEKEIMSTKDYPSYCRLNTKYQKEVDFHLDMVSDYPKRKGKYLRPTLLLLTAEAMGVKKSLARETAAAMQISEDVAYSSVRFSIGRHNTTDEINICIEKIREFISKEI